MLTVLLTALLTSWLVTAVVDDKDSDDPEWVPAASWEASELEAALLDEVEVALGRAGARRDLESRLAALEEDLGPLVAVMPKNEYGLLGPTSARFALHRFFVRRHAWFVNGLEAHGEAWDSASPTDLFKGHVSDNVRGLFEKRFLRGLSVKGLALLAGTFEYLVQREAELRLQAVYALHDMSSNESVPYETAEDMLNTHMGTLILKIDTSKLHDRQKYNVPYILRRYHKAYRHHVEIERIVSETLQDPSRKNAVILSYGQVTNILADVLKRYEEWSGHAECQDLKHLLLKAEQADTGCVLLSDFYGNSSALKDAWQFKESPGYLREIGALDESDQENPHVIVSNYIQGASNCLASSSWYSLCCVNECEPLFQHIEKEIGAPEAFPAQLAAIVRELPSSTVTAPRVLSQSLIFHLHEIAWSHNSGMVPLHGRLFAQWMHHVYPRECPFPHPVGTTFPSFSGQRISNEKRKELAQHLGHRPLASTGMKTCTPWRAEEETLGGVLPSASHPMVNLEDDIHLWTGMRSVAILTLLICMVLYMVLQYALVVKRTLRSPPLKV